MLYQPVCTRRHVLEAHRGLDSAPTGQRPTKLGERRAGALYRESLLHQSNTSTDSTLCRVLYQIAATPTGGTQGTVPATTRGSPVDRLVRSTDR